MTEKEKFCIGCGKMRPASEFGGLFGANGYCNSCVYKNFNPEGLIRMGSGT